jgi:hypothetical protein
VLISAIPTIMSITPAPAIPRSLRLKLKFI